MMATMNLDAPIYSVVKHALAWSCPQLPVVNVTLLRANVDGSWGFQVEGKAT